MDSTSAETSTGSGDGDGDGDGVGDGDDDGGDGGNGGGDGDGDGVSDSCGDGIIDPGEECDLGPANDDMGTCKSDCTNQACGDGFIGPNEACDDGSANADDAACTSACVVATCGDGMIHVGVEDCDDAGESPTCNVDCTTATCGDAKLNVSAGEFCDGDIGMHTCLDEGFLGGILECADTCDDYDRSNCYNEFFALFTTCGKTGNTGPSQQDCDAAYQGQSQEGQVTVNAGIQTWTVPYTATYTIEVWGAQAGHHNFGIGGKGARMKGDFELDKGDLLRILVGQKGSDGTGYDVGGGGGTFVVLGDDTPLIVAGGGGGAGNCSHDGHNLPQMNGKATIGDGSGGVGDNDGMWCGCGGNGSPGGGFDSDGMPSGGRSFLNGGRGDDGKRINQCVNPGLGGFGGGGNGGNGGGGGGGYSGGDGGGETGGAPGKGGESYNAGANQDGETGVWADHGKVEITLVI